MSFWNDAEWRRAGNATPAIVDPFDADAIDDGKYKLKVGDEVYISTGEDANTIRRLSRNESFAIKPGEFAFLITQEVVSIPPSCLGFISMTTKVKFHGLVNVSGFHVDPAYSGRLIFAVFNAGPKKIHLKEGQRIFSLWIARFESVLERETRLGYDSLSTEVVNQLEGQFLTAYQLSERVDGLNGNIEELDDKVGKLESRIVKLEHGWGRFWIYAGAIGGILLIIFTIFRGPISDKISSWLGSSGPEKPPQNTSLHEDIRQ